MTFDPHAEFGKLVYNIRFEHISTNPYCLTYEKYRAKMERMGLITKDKNSPGRCWIRSLFPDKEDEV